MLPEDSDESIYNQVTASIEVDGCLAAAALKMESERSNSCWESSSQQPVDSNSSMSSLRSNSMLFVDQEFPSSFRRQFPEFQDFTTPQTMFTIPNHQQQQQQQLLLLQQQQQQLLLLQQQQHQQQQQQQLEEQNILNTAAAFSSITETQAKQEMFNLNQQNEHYRSEKTPHRTLFQRENHILAERQRREEMNERFSALKTLLPKSTKKDKASIVGETISYIVELEKKLKQLQTASSSRQPVTHKKQKTLLPESGERDSQNSVQVEIQCLGAEAVIKIVSNRLPNLPLRTLKALEDCKADVIQSSVTTSGNHAVLYFTVELKTGVSATTQEIIAALESYIVGYFIAPSSSMEADARVGVVESSSQTPTSITNLPLVAAFISFFVAQSLKIVTTWYKEKRWDLKRMAGSGGMPSSHSATVVGLAVAIALKDGTGGSLFAIAIVLACIVMYDASGVRFQAGRQAEVLNQIVFELPPEHPLSDARPLREPLGHTPPQVAAGALLGCVISYTVYLISLFGA